MADLATIGFRADTRDLKKAQRELDKTAKSGMKTEKSVAGLSKGFKALGAAVAALGLARVASSVVSANLAIEAISSSLTVATGSAEGAAREMAFLRQESERLGLDLRTSADAFASLAAAARGTALEGQGARDIFVGVSEAMTALGRDSFATEGALRAIEQMISKGNVSAEELRGQLGERLPGAFNLAAKSIGVTTQELNKMLQDGDVLAADMLPKLARELSKTFSAQAENKAAGLQAEINRFRTAVFDLMASGNMVGLASAVSDFTSLISDPNFQKSFGALLSGLVKIAELSGSAAAGFANFGTWIGESIARLQGYEDTADRVKRLQEELNEELAKPLKSRSISGRQDPARIEAIREELKLYEMIGKARTESLSGGGATPDAPAVKVISEEQIKAIKNAREAITGLNQQVMQSVDTFGMSESQILQYRLTVGDLSSDIKLLGAEGQELVKSIVAQQEAYEALAESEETRNVYRQLTQDLSNQRAEIGMTERELFIYQAQSRLSATATADMRKEVDYLAGSLYDEREALDASNEAKERGKSIMEGLRTPMEEYIDNLKEIEQLEKAGGLNSAQAEKARDRMTDQYIEQIKSTQDLDTFTKRAAENMQDAMGNFFFDFMQGELGNLEQSFKQTIDRMVAEALAANLGKALFGSTLGGEGAGLLGGLASTVGGFFGFGGGSSVASVAQGLPSSIPSLAGMRADGGPVSANKPYLVGERGPEIMMPNTSGQIIPNNQIGGGINVTVMVNGVRDEGGLKRTADQIAQQAGRASQRAIGRNT